MLSLTLATLPSTLFLSSSAGETSLFHSSSQRARLLVRLSPISCSFGHKRTCATTKGAIMNSMKPICEFGRFSLSRSLRNCTGMPNSFSRSPCSKNSSKHFHAHACVTSQALHGFETSAACRTVLMTNSFVASSLLKTSCSSGIISAGTPSTMTPCLSKTSQFISYVTCRSFTIAIWPIMSVCRIVSMTTFLHSLYCSFVRFSNTFASRFPMMV
mmetsp:Transcript_46727/g.108977  ORF Transcript_46727/g.108977 Transcript_46727/m.108977 type:complete len:214 (+) Transcript_46727:161-802(+)